MFDQSPKRAVRPAVRDASTLRAFQLFFALHCAGFLALQFAPEGDHGIRSILRLLAVGAPAGGGTPVSSLAAPWQLVSHVFLHVHALEFAASVALLLALGSEVERVLGTMRFSALYLGTGALVALGHEALVALGAPTATFVGGLGAGAGALAAYVLVEPRRNVLGVVPAPGFFVVATSILFAVTAYLEQEPQRRMEELLRLPLNETAFPTWKNWLDMVHDLGTKSVAVLPHLLGIAVGACALAVDFGVVRVAERARMRREIRTLEEELEARAKVEQLLEKISRDGLEALSRRERKFLQYASRFYPNGSKAAR